MLTFDSTNMIAGVIFVLLVSATISTAYITTVSGASSGAAMATQLHLAFSRDISGCGILAGPPFYCAGNALTVTACMSGPVTSISVPALRLKLESYEMTGSIDDLSNIKNHPVYIFSGKYDPIAFPGVVKLSEKLYSPLGAKIMTNYDMPATHGFPTDNFGGKCDTLNSNNFLNNCNFSLAYDVLNHLHGGNLVKPQFGAATPLLGQMVVFDQKAFINPPSELTMNKKFTRALSQWIKENLALYNPESWGWPTSGFLNLTMSSVTVPFRGSKTMTRGLSYGFDDQGFIYFPSACATGKKCSIHVALHGCKQGKSFIGDVFVTKAGYLEVAELNNLIVIFPQIRETNFLPTNPSGCWDWWGYTSQRFATKTGPQMSGIRNIIRTVKMINTKFTKIRK